MKPIFEYSDYRLFLRDYMNFSRDKGPSLTYKVIGEKVGFKSKGFFTQIIQGKSNIPENKIRNLGLALGLNKKELEYFELLVRFNQAKTHDKKNEYFKQLVSKFKTRIQHMGPDKYEFYNAWYYSAIRSLLGYYPFNGDYKKLAKQLNPPITPGQAKKAIELLTRLKLIEKKEDGYYRLTDRIIFTGDTIGAVGIINFQQATMDLAKESLERFPKEMRHSSTLTLGLSEEGYRAVVKKLQNYVRRFLRSHGMTDVLIGLFKLIYLRFRLLRVIGGVNEFCQFLFTTFKSWHSS
ncbi:MAG: TIGR02147 family protein [Chitinispirillaceae bacterium]|nr:TIGR02147 family protein [Chitinispirillaceae bacterium]